MAAFAGMRANLAEAAILRGRVARFERQPLWKSEVDTIMKTRCASSAERAIGGTSLKVP
jgi:hypothetical protein